MRRTRLALVALSLGTALLAAGPAAAQAPEVTATGRVLWDGPAPPPVPVPCCTVEVVLTPASGRPWQGFGTTDADGRYEIPVPCLGTPPFVIVATALCCGATSAPQTADSCSDPVTMLPITVDLGDMTCSTAPVTDQSSLHGNVACRSGLFLEPVADCGILVRDAAGTPLVSTRTDAAGDWDACVTCFPATAGALLVEAQCCGIVQDVPEDPGCPLERAVPTFVCDPCPEPPCPDPREVELRGSVVCPPEPGGTGPEPWPSCPVTVQVRDAAGILVEEHEVETGPDGTWTLCVPCPADSSRDGLRWTVTAISGCCASQEVLTVDGCPPAVEVPPNECDPTSCAGLPTCGTAEKQVRGRVTCLDPLFPGGRRPVADCLVLVEGQGCIDADGDTICELLCPTVRGFTDVNGDYSFCLPCAECTGVVVTATCCGVTRTEALPTDCGTTTVVDLDCGDCGTTGGPCGPDARQVNGFVTCPEGSPGTPTPVPGCGVRLTCPGSGEETVAWTDESGWYEACLPCPACDAFVAEALCCGEVRTLADPTCAGVRQDFECGSCDSILGHCPGPPAVRASGVVRCVQSSGDTPLAGCTVTLTGEPAGGGPPVVATAVTDGAGRYEACLDCVDGAGLTSLTATSACCGTSVTDPVDGCPAAQELPPLDCRDCSPCPVGFTRLQGRVHCRGGGPVEGCAVRVLIDTCDGPEILLLTTDSEGKYRACVPCPCEGSVLRVTAGCCGATRAVPIDACGPITPVPTLTCPVPCP